MHNESPTPEVFPGSRLPAPGPCVTDPRSLFIRHLGRLDYGSALSLQRQLVSERQAGLIPDQLLLVEHPHVITLGRNGHEENLLAAPEILSRAGISFYRTDRGGDITYHGPGQLVGYPIMDLRAWKRDVGAYMRSIEQILIDTLSDFGIGARRIPKLTGVWVGDRKIAAIGVHISRWVTSHGFALNVSTDLSYFQYIVPCGLTKPVTAMAQLRGDSSAVNLAAVGRSLVSHFGRIFEYQLVDSSETLIEDPLLAASQR
jgi:lipoyl(octanoyl) transferase